MKSSKVFKIILWLLFSIATLITICFLVISGLLQNKTSAVERNAVVLKEWEYKDLNNTSHSAVFPGKIDGSLPETITVSTKLPSDISDGMYLCMYDFGDIEIFIDDESRFSFDAVNADVPGGIVKSTYMFCPLSKEDSGKTVSISKSGSNVDRFETIYVGDSLGIAEKIIKNRLPLNISILALLLFSAAIVIFSIVFRLAGERNVSTVFIGLGILAASVWLILKSDLIPVVTGVHYVDGPASYMLLMLLPYPFIEYLDRMQNFRRVRLQNVLRLVVLLNFVVFTALHFSHVNSFAVTRDIFESVIGVVTIAELALILVDVFQHNVDNYKIVLAGFLCFILLSVFEIIRINIAESSSRGILIILGLFILLCTAVFQQFMESNWLQQQINIKTRQLDQLTIYNKELKNRADQDSLTGLYNGAYLKNVAAKLLDEDANGCYIMIDLDNFKQVNDTYGHIAGDLVLKKLAENIKIVFRRQNDIVARMGGDEFGVFISGYISREHITEKLEELRSSYLSTPELSEYSNKLGLSMGIAISPDDSYNIEDLYRQADNALYFTKENHKGGYRFYSYDSETTPEEVSDKSAIMADMDYIKSIIEGGIGYEDGALSVGYDNFKQIYNYLFRYVKRNDTNIQILLFTLNSTRGGYPDIVELNIAMNALNHAVVDSLRRVDVGTSYSSHQYIVILTDTDIVNGDMVAKRVVKQFQKTSGARNISISYEIETLGKNEDLNEGIEDSSED